MPIIAYLVKEENIMIYLIYDLSVDKTHYKYYCINQLIQQYNNTEDA